MRNNDVKLREILHLRFFSLFRLSDAFELVNFSHGDYIVRQGTSGDTFYIISEGQVRVTRRVEGKGRIYTE